MCNWFEYELNTTSCVFELSVNWICKIIYVIELSVNWMQNHVNWIDCELSAKSYLDELIL